MHIDPQLITIAISLLGGILAQAIGRRLKVPAIAPLLLLGVLLGPVCKLLFDYAPVQPQSLGSGLKVLVGVAVAIILFEGGLSLKTEAFRFSGVAIRRLVFVGALLTWVVSAVFAHLLFPDLGNALAALFGALIIVTGPTVILPLLQTIHPRRRVADTLRGEAILIDPVGAIAAVLVLEMILAEHTEPSALFSGLVVRIALGTVLGFVGAWLLNKFLRMQHDRAPEFQNRTVLVGAVALFALSETLAEESGVLTVTVAGFVLGWFHPPGIEAVEEFKGHVVAILVSTLFILLSANLDLQAMLDLGWPGLLLVGCVILVVRPIAVFLSTVGTKLTFKEKAFLSWVAPRGIVAASVSSLFAIALERHHVDGGQTVQALTFAVILGTVLIQAPTAGWVGRKLGVLDLGRVGFLVMGCNTAGRFIGRALAKKGLRVVCLDTNLRNVELAQEEGLSARRANALDEFTISNMDLDGIGHFVAMTPNDLANRVACRLLADDFGRVNVRAIAQSDSPEQEGEHAPPYLFGRRLPYAAFVAAVKSGATMGHATVDEATDLKGASELTGGGIPLWAFKGDQVRFLTDDAALEPGEELWFLDLVRSSSDVGAT